MATPPAERCSNSEIRIVVAGRTGGGKSATCNTILGRDVFKTGFSSQSTTTDLQVESVVIDEHSVKVVDLPGFFDTEHSEETVIEKVMRSLIVTHPGPHALLYVIRPGPYTSEEYNTYIRLKKAFGEGITEHIIIVLTHGDELEENQISDSVYMESSSKELKSVFDECGLSCIVFNNKHPGNVANDLIRMIKERDSGPYETCPYSKDIEEAMDEHIKNRLLDAQQEELKDNQYVKQLISERDKAISERDKAISERDKAISERNEAKSERDEANTQRDQSELERDQANSERDEANSERDKAKSERDEAKSERDEAKSERDEANTERDKVTIERDKAITERNIASSERDRAKSERDEANTERDKANFERDEANIERDRANFERGEANTERDRANFERDRANFERDRAITERDEANTERNRAGVKCQKAIIERKEANSALAQSEAKGKKLTDQLKEGRRVRRFSTVAGIAVGGAVAVASAPLTIYSIALGVAAGSGVTGIFGHVFSE